MSTDQAWGEAQSDEQVEELPKRKRRGREPGTPVPTLPELPAEEFETFYMVDPDERVDFKRRTKDRTPQQQAIDKLVAENFKEWRDAGEPTNWADMPVISWPVSASFAEVAEKMLRKAAAWHGRKLITGHHITREDGKVVIPFVVIARPPKRERNTQTPEDNDTPPES